MAPVQHAAARANPSTHLAIPPGTPAKPMKAEKESGFSNRRLRWPVMELPILQPYLPNAIPLPNAALVASSLCLAAGLLTLVRWFTSPLRRIPGPLLASITDIWRLRNAFSGREEKIYIDVHKKYGMVL